jgi:hypothetical protein
MIMKEEKKINDTLKIPSFLMFLLTGVEEELLILIRMCIYFFIFNTSQCEPLVIVFLLSPFFIYFSLLPDPTRLLNLPPPINQILKSLPSTDLYVTSDGK